MKNTFIKSTIILLIGGFLTKLIGFIIRISYTRIIGTEGITLYSLITPTYSLLITLANFNIQLAISKKISSGSRAKKTLINSCYIMFFLDCLLILKPKISSISIFNLFESCLSSSSPVLFKLDFTCLTLIILLDLSFVFKHFYQQAYQ